MNISYLVVSLQNSSDAYMPIYAPRLLTTDPSEALKAARSIMHDKHIDCICGVHIFTIEKDRVYDLADRKTEIGKEAESAGLVYTSHVIRSNPDGRLSLGETFNDDTFKIESRADEPWQV